MYAREVKGKELNFTVSGMLWQRSLVMRDPETGTLWSHLLGKGMEGALEGEVLTLLPGEMTDWASWKRRYPGTSVLAMERTARRFLREYQKSPGRFVLGFRKGEETTAFPFDVLKKARVANATVGGQAIVVTFDPESASARVFSRVTSDGTTHVFEPVSGRRMRDQMSGSVWDAESGRCVAGQFEGAGLAPEVGIPSFLRAWRRFYPESSEWEWDRPGG